MKHFLTLIFAVLTINCFSQNHTTIYFLGSKFLSGKIYINNKVVGNIGQNETVEYHCTEEGRLNITVTKEITDCYSTIDVKPGGTYYYKVHNCSEIQETEATELLARSTRKTVIEEEKEVLKAPVGKPLPVKNSVQAACILVNKEGILLTSYDAVKGASTIKIKGIGNDFSVSYPADLIAFDVQLNLALLKIRTPGIKYESIPYSFSNSVSEPGTAIFAIDFMKSQVPGEIKITEGIIGAKNNPDGSVSHYTVSTAETAWNIGCLLFNNKGEIIGIINEDDSPLKSPYINTFLSIALPAPMEKSPGTLAGLSLQEKVKVLKGFIFMVQTD